jgi:hypothetical protein
VVAGDLGRSSSLPAIVPAQTSFSANAAKRTAPVSKSWSPPRTADGHPDLQGTWTNATLTPLQRPSELGAKEYFSEQEAAAYEKLRLEQTNVDRPEARRQGDVGAYNQAFWDRGMHVVKTRRTSLVVDPPDGKIPPMTPDAQAKFERTHAELARRPADGPEDRNLSERCLLFSGVGPPILPEPYNNNYQIVQSPGYLAILAEMNHDVRIIPTEQRPHLAGAVRQWTGDSLGRWEGDTLVVETTGIKSNNHSHFGVIYDGMTDENLRVVERFTRTDPDTIMYRATVDDPTVYTHPWTIEESLAQVPGPLFEYACHEGNYGMAGILSGARAKEK